MSSSEYNRLFTQKRRAMFSKPLKKSDDSVAAGQTAAPFAAEFTASDVPVGAYKTTISAGSTLSGQLEVDTDLQVDGEVKGRLRVGKKFVIGKEGRVASEGIDCSVAEISGLLEGPLTATEMLTIHAGGHIKGDICVRDVVIEKGGRLDGRCQYLASEQSGAPGPPASRRTIVSPVSESSQPDGTDESFTQT